MKKKKLIGLSFALFLVFILFFNWIYPYSALSVTGSVPYKSDPIVVEQYNKGLKEFKKKYQNHVDEGGLHQDLTTDRIQYILQMYEQEWLLSKESMSLSKLDLDGILSEVQEARRLLIQLTFEESYDKETKMFLKILLEDTLDLEKRISYLIHSEHHTRQELDNVMGNVHMSFISNFNLFTTFFETYSGQR
ncbi:hypothetical protein [Pseudalkalibacillus sp. SCS-8]|uniref:hypothetical protein n=1 Tax=Pseudalkalibacillus nanhaiensis TaxID=3115291 RepID=UPI0032DAD895